MEVCFHSALLHLKYFSNFCIAAASKQKVREFSGGNMSIVAQDTDADLVIHETVRGRVQAEQDLFTTAAAGELAEHVIQINAEHKR